MKHGANVKQMRGKLEANAEQARISKTRLCFKDFAVCLQKPLTRARRVYALGACTCTMLEHARRAQVLGVKLREHAWGAKVREYA